MSVSLLGGLILSTVAFALNAFLVGYLLTRYTSAWLTYRSYAITSASLIAAVWLTLLIGASILLPRERVAKAYGQFGSLVSIVTIVVIGFITAASVCAIGLSQTQRTLTPDLKIVRTFFGTILALTFLSFLWVLISGGMALKRSRLSFYAEGLREEKERNMTEEERKRAEEERKKEPEELVKRRQKTKQAQDKALEAQQRARDAQEELESQRMKRVQTREELNRLTKLAEEARIAESVATESVRQAQLALQDEMNAEQMLYLNQNDEANEPRGGGGGGGGDAGGGVVAVAGGGRGGDEVMERLERLRNNNMTKGRNVRGLRMSRYLY